MANLKVGAVMSDMFYIPPYAPKNAEEAFLVNAFRCCRKEAKKALLFAAIKIVSAEPGVETHISHTTEGGAVHE